MRSGKLAAWAAAALVCASRAGAGRAGAGLFLATVRRLRPARASSPISRCRSPMTTARSTRRGARGASATAVAAVARRFACGPATDAISRSPASDNASRAACCNSFCPASETKVFSGSNIDNADRRKRQVLFGPAERVPLSQRARQRLHLQRQGPDRSRAGQDRERSDAAQGRHRRRRERPAGRRPQRRQARRGAEFLARLRKVRAKYDRVPVVARE